MAARVPQRNIVTVTTNVPGPRVPLFMLGRRLERLMPYVPIASRLRFGIAIFSYCDELTFGVTGDYDAADVDVLVAELARSVDELAARARADKPRSEQPSSGKQAVSRRASRPAPHRASRLPA